MPSIVAALYPAKVPYKYFVAFPDGHHEFRATVRQHDVAVKASRKAWAAYWVLHPSDTSDAPAVVPVPVATSSKGSAPTKVKRGK